VTAHTSLVTGELGMLSVCCPTDCLRLLDAASAGFSAVEVKATV